ncbi:MAG TPA: hypothetical protein VKQ71_08510 [Acidimicrobiales bacterium]|nr:hypothetical protein [Acidimicrobiales bacterium]
MRKVLAVAAAFGMFAALGVLQVSASDDGYNPPPAVQGVCDAGHGAFGAFSHHTGTWIPTDAREDGGLGAATGPANSGLGLACAPGLG